MVDEDVEVDREAGVVVGFGKGGEAAGEGVEAVKSEDFDSEGKGWGGGGGSDGGDRSKQRSVSGVEDGKRRGKAPMKEIAAVELRRDR
ncbi:hypothetical protein V6N13_002147 [Hibiscus sabdariffa]